MKRETADFTLLDEREDPNCQHVFIKEVIEEGVLVNSNNEFVVGYGRGPVTRITSRKRQFCRNCGYVKEEDRN